MAERAHVPYATPLVDTRLSADKNMPARSRRLTGDALGEIEPDTRYNFLLMLSELVANTVLHSRTPERLRVLRVGDRLRVEVYDDSSDFPVVMTPSPHRVHGRGMLLVDALASDWGVNSTPSGKVVWAEVRLSAAPSCREAHVDMFEKDQVRDLGRT